MAKEKNPLGTFEGRDVVAVEVIVRKTGDGLSETVKTEPKLIYVGDEGYIVFAYKSVDIHHRAHDRKEPSVGGVIRVQVLDAGTSTFIDADVVVEAVRAQAEKNQRFREQQQGTQRIEDGLLLMDHDDGKHVGDVFPVQYCAKCDEEVAVIEAETRGQ